MKSSLIVIAALLGYTKAIRPTEDVALELDVEANARQNVRQTLKNQLRAALSRGDAYPTVILPGSSPVMPIPSDPIELQLDTQESNARMTARQEVAEELRDFLYPQDNLLQLDAKLADDDLSVEDARVQAAQMQAQMD